MKFFSKLLRKFYEIHWTQPFLHPPIKLKPSWSGISTPGSFHDGLNNISKKNQSVNSSNHVAISLIILSIIDEREAWVRCRVTIELGCHIRYSGYFFIDFFPLIYLNYFLSLLATSCKTHNSVQSNFNNIVVGNLLELVSRFSLSHFNLYTSNNKT